MQINELMIKSGIRYGRSPTDLFLYLNDSDQESLLILLMHRPADGSNGPAQCV